MTLTRIDQFPPLPIDGLAVLEVAKKDDADEGVAGDEREHAHDDEEALVHGHNDGLDEHAEGGVFAGDGEEAQDDGEVAENDDGLVAGLQRKFVSFGHGQELRVNLLTWLP